jgi:hypothetical protein
MMSDTIQSNTILIQNNPNPMQLYNLSSYTIPMNLPTKSIWVGGILHVHIAHGKNLPVGSLQLTKSS